MSGKTKVYEIDGVSIVGTIRPSDDRDRQALEELKALAKVPGALKIIKPFHACQPGRLLDDRIHADRKAGGELARACDAWAEWTGHTVKSPHHYDLADVARIDDEPNASGWIKVYADDPENSSCAGRPAALLARLREHARA